MTDDAKPVDQTDLAAQLQAVKDGATEKRRTVFDLIEEHQEVIAKALPQATGLTPSRFTRLVRTEVRRNMELARCTEVSLLGAMMFAAQLGVEPGPLGHAYLVPYWNNKLQAKEATFILGYRGIIALTWRSQMLASIQTRVVVSGDEFSYAYGLDEHLNHVPRTVEVGQERPDPTHYYAIARYVNGGRFFEVMSLSDILRRRDASKANTDRGPWVTNFDPMARKTLIRAMAPYMPLNAVVAEAFATDERVRYFDADAEGLTRVGDDAGPIDPTAEPPPDDDAPPIDDAILLDPCTGCGEPIPEGDDVDDEWERVDHTDAERPEVEGPHHRSCLPR